MTLHVHNEQKTDNYIALNYTTAVFFRLAQIGMTFYVTWSTANPRVLFHHKSLYKYKLKYFIDKNMKTSCSIKTKISTDTWNVSVRQCYTSTATPSPEDLGVPLDLSHQRVIELLLVSTKWKEIQLGRGVYIKTVTQRSRQCNLDFI